MNERERRLAERIAQLLGAGIETGPDLREYIDATYSQPSPADLERILADESDPDREGLLELIFFPDEPLQQNLEDLLPEEGGLEQADVESIAADLTARHLRCTLIFSDGRLAIDFTPDSVRTFLERLNLTCPIPPHLAMAIATRVVPAGRVAARVKLRNSRNTGGAVKEGFLSDFFAGLGRDNQFLTCLDFVLDFLEDIDEGDDIYTALMDRRRTGRMLLHKAAQFEQKLRHDNIETLMLRGERAPHVSRDALWQSIFLIERISLAVFGRLDPLDTDIPQNVDVAFQSNGDVADMIRRLM
ncbi:MAG: hypothetical protein WAK95_10110 [Desulfobacterales bacterium]